MVENFLKDRRQRVIINGRASTWKPVVSGIPQGSVLGPVLFALYISDICHDLTAIVKLFADDVKLLWPVSSEETAQLFKI